MFFWIAFKVTSRDEVSFSWNVRTKMVVPNEPDIIDAHAQLYLLLPQRPSAMHMQHRTPPLRIAYLPLLHPDALARPLRRAALHLLDRIPTAVCTRLGVVTLRVPLLSAKAELLVLLCALGIALTITALVAGGLCIVVEGNVEEIFFMCVADLGTLSFCWGLLAFVKV
jgi:hypothetical protein